MEARLVREVREVVEEVARGTRVEEVGMEVLLLKEVEELPIMGRVEVLGPMMVTVVVVVAVQVLPEQTRQVMAPLAMEG